MATITSTGDVLKAQKNEAAPQGVYLLASVKETSNGYSVVSANESPVALQDGKLRDKIFKETGKYLPTRAEVNGGKADWNKIVDTNFPDAQNKPELVAQYSKSKLLGSNVLNTVHVDGKTDVALVNYTTFKNLNQFKTPGAVGHSEDLQRDGFETVNQETPLITVHKDKNGKDVIGLHAVYPEGASKSERMGYVLKFQQDSERVLKEFHAAHPEYANAPVERYLVESQRMKAKAGAVSVTTHIGDYVQELSTVPVVNTKENSFGIVEAHRVTPQTSYDAKDVKVFSARQFADNTSTVVPLDKFEQLNGTLPARNANAYVTGKIGQLAAPTINKPEDLSSSKGTTR